MLTADNAPLTFKKRIDGPVPPGVGGTELDQLLDLQRPKQPRRILHCRQCRRPITRPSERTEINHRHVHEYSNPHGFRFRIGCFRDAPGAVAHGESVDAWSWFPGYHWRLALCVGCHVHLGWHYSGGEPFWGLILDRLVEADDDDGD